MSDTLTSKKCVLKIVKEGDRWALNIVRDGMDAWTLAYSPIPIEVIQADKPYCDGLWSPYGNSGMRYMEISDVTGGETDQSFPKQLQPKETQDGQIHSRSEYADQCTRLCVADGGATEREAGRVHRGSGTGDREEILRLSEGGSKLAAIDCPVSDDQYTCNMLDSLAGWLESRSRTVWAKEYKHDDLMQTYGAFLRRFIAARATVEPSALQPGLHRAKQIIEAVDCYTAQGARDSGLAFADISTERVKAFRDHILDKIEDEIFLPETSQPPVDPRRNAAELSFVSGKTLDVTHIFDGEEVVTGGDDGQTWVATFADAFEAKRFVQNSKHSAFMIRGCRRAVTKGDGL